MVFGIGGGLCFAYLPFMKMGNLPVVSYRMFPGTLIRRLPKILGVPYYRKRYKNQGYAMEELDAAIKRNQIIALQTSAYFTTYFPPEMRFQFNAHNIIIIGKDGDEYIVSDPVFDHLVRIGSSDLKKARFARGFSAPNGLMHYPVRKPEHVDINHLIKKSIKKTANMMLYAPLPWIGIKGINYLSRTIQRLPKKKDPRYARQFLGNVVRMQEEIGTGGAGFRFLYAAFLQEAGERLGTDELFSISKAMTKTGDVWREFAVQCATAVKHKGRVIDYDSIARRLRGCGEAEQDIYRRLSKLRFSK
jgi:hypothetical protein